MVSRRRDETSKRVHPNSFGQAARQARRMRKSSHRLFSIHNLTAIRALALAFDKQHRTLLNQENWDAPHPNIQTRKRPTISLMQHLTLIEASVPDFDRRHLAHTNPKKMGCTLCWQDFPGNRGARSQSPGHQVFGFQHPCEVHGLRQEGNPRRQIRPDPKSRVRQFRSIFASFPLGGSLRMRGLGSDPPRKAA